MLRRGTKEIGLINVQQMNDNACKNPRNFLVTIFGENLSRANVYLNLLLRVSFSIHR